MKFLVLTSLLLVATGAAAQSPQQDYPSCDLQAQQSLKVEGPDATKDPMRAHVFMRANSLQADIGKAAKAQRLSKNQADRLLQRIEKVRVEVDGFVRQQGFLSAGERASYDRDFNDIAKELCR